MEKPLAAAAIAIAAAAAAIWRICQRHRRWPGTAPGTALLVIAHPDDEAMFFVPTAAALRDSGWSTHILCLSNGGGGGDGAVRERELVASAALLGVPPGSVHQVDVPELPDSMDQTGPRCWKAEVVRGIIATAVADHSATMVVTFDAGGVSGHPNHIATFRGVAAYAEHPRAVPVFVLDTVPIPRKFSSVLDVLTSYIAVAWCSGASRRRVLVTYPSAALADACMQAHASQYRWFRKLFVWFARYPFVNTLTAVRAAALEVPAPTTAPVAITAEPQASVGSTAAGEAADSEEGETEFKGKPSSVRRRRPGSVGPRGR